jgi:tetratricopeptide (TPR) repeat protein
MPRLLILVSLFIACSGMISHAQEKAAERYLEVRGTSELEMQPLARATAHLYEGTTEIQAIQTGSDGGFSFRLEINKQYTIEVEKEGLVSKRISFNTAMPDEEKGAWMNEFSIGLLKFCDGVDYSTLKESVDNVKFDQKRREFVSDKDYVNRMRPRLESVLAKYDQCMLNKYDAAIKKGDQAFLQKNTKDALAAYQEALDIYPRETYPSKQINEINRQLGKQQKSAEQSEKQAQSNIEDKYNLSLAKASVAYTKKDFATAKQYYQDALKIKPDESIPKARMQEIETILARKAADDAKIMEVDKAYNFAVLKADSLMKAKNYPSAREQFAKASAIKPGEGYPKAKSQEIDRIEEANARVAENTRKAAAENEYQAVLDRADGQFKTRSFDEAKASYGKAMAMRPSDPYPAQRVKLVENAMVAQKQKALEDQATKQYQEIIGSADQYLQSKDLAKAREAYTRALAVKTDDQYAQSKISAIDNTIAAEQTAKFKATEDGYKAAIGAANTAVTQKTYAQAKEFLQKALAIKAGDAYATNRLAEVDKLIDEQRKALEQEELKKSQYKEAASAADKLYNAGDLTAARKAYNSLFQFKPGDPYASQKISSIDDLIAAETAKKQKQSDDSYTNAMTMGTESLARKDFSKAREAFQQALTIKSGDISATNKLRDTELLMAQEQERVATEKARKKNYDDNIAAADKYMAQKNFADAGRAYETALATIPGEPYPRQKLDEIAKILDEQEKVIAGKQATENAYQLAISSADRYFKAKDYVKAKNEYARAITLKPGEEFPKTRLAEMDNLIKLQLQEQAQAKARADAYSEAINKGNVQFAGKEYSTAKASYSEALKQIPDDKLAREQIEKIDYILAEQEKQKKAESARKASYDAMISSADNAYNSGNYSGAKEDYRKALAIDPGSVYAKQRIAKIDEIARVLAQTTPSASSASASAGQSKKTAAIPMGELIFRTESEKQKYLDELKKKYSPGITLEKYKEKYKEIFRYIVIRDNQAQEFRQVKFLTYNGLEFSFNGKPITQQYFLSQVKTRQGENFQEIEMQ